MERKLTQTERANLQKQHKRERDKRICDRIKAVLAYDDGYTYSEIARILLLDDETIRRHIDRYHKDNKLAPQNGGSDGKLSVQETRELTDHLQEVTYLYVKDICQYVSTTYGTKFTVSGMTKWMHAHEFCYKKPHAVPAKADKVKQRKFIQYYKRLKKSAGKNEPIYFADSVHPQHQTQLAYGWILKGVRKEIATTAYQKRLNFIGGICLNGHRFTYQRAETVNASSICDFLLKLRKANPGNFTVHVIWDNAKYHKNLEVSDFAKDLGIQLHYLPPYSPNLNPIERIWKLMHEVVRYNQYYGKFCEFTDATLEFFRGIGRKKCILRNRITDNFHILHSPLFAS